ncbi:MAG TPA: DUF2490 domain-containing protein [Cyclobacteriaceae bacterium]|nr:DUF2490 domain-containing protein [Cyclobacteriaceae bacterium]
MCGCPLPPRTLALAACIFCAGAASAQGINQFWADYSADYPFANKYLAEIEASYQTLTSDKDKWRSYSLTPDFEVNITPHLDLMGQTLFSYTDQTATYSSFEVRPIFIAKYYFSPGKRIDPRLSIKYEHRMFHELDIDNWLISNRFRVHGEVIVPINHESIFTDKLWYGLVEGEWFWLLDKNVKERFVNITFVRMGIGYRLSYSLRFETFYIIQTTHNELDGSDATEGIVRIRIKHFLRKVGP